MTKILYIPNGLYINFRSKDNPANEYTVYYEKSHWYAVWKDNPNEVILWLCNPANEADLKEAMGIPVDVELNKEGFEVITND